MHSHVVPFIFASGHGTRLRPLTESTPKPLLPVRGEKTIIDLTIENLLAHGFTTVFVNYSYGEEHFTALKKKYASRISIALVDDQEVCGQGGILVKTRDALQTTPYVLCLNGDTVIDFDLDTFVHNPQPSEIRLLSDDSKPVIRNLLCDSKGIVYGRHTTDDTSEINWYEQTDVELSQHNYLGVSLIPTAPLSHVTMPTPFMGFFGEGELIEQYYAQHVRSRIESVAITQYQTANTAEELTALRAALQ